MRCIHTIPECFREATNDGLYCNAHRPRPAPDAELRLAIMALDARVKALESELRARDREEARP